MATQVAPDTLPEAQGAQPRTIARLWQDAVAAERTQPAYLVERDRGWEPVAWAEAAAAVEELANGLLSLGVRKGDAFGILAQICVSVFRSATGPASAESTTSVVESVTVPLISDNLSGLC